MKSGRMLPLLGALALVLAACGPAATLTPTTAPTPGSGLRATATPTPAATPPPGLAATATPTPRPTATPVAASGVPKYGGTLRFPLRSDPPGWDGQASTSGDHDMRIQQNTIFNLLATLEVPEPALCTSNLNPELAESWQWLNDLTLEVKLRQGVKFHNKPPVSGREMTASDVVFSYNRGMTIWPTRGIKVAADPIDRIVAADRYTVRFINKRPNPGLVPTAFASKYGMVVFPEGVGDPKERWQDPERYWIGTGPFMFKQWVPGVKSVLEKNPTYWQAGRPYVDRIEFLIMPDQSMRLAAMRAGRLDLWQRDLGATAAENLQATAPRIIMQRCPPPSSTLGVLYIRQDVPPFDNVLLRRALAMAIDKEAIRQKILMGYGRPMGVFPPSHLWYMKPEEFPAETRKYLEYHPDEARKLLAQAGYSAGVPFTISYSATRYPPTFGAIVEAVAQMAQSVGFVPKIRTLDYVYFIATTARGNWSDDEHVNLQYVSRGENLWADVMATHSANLPADNKGRTKDPEYDKLAEAFASELNEAKQRELLRQIQLRIAEQVYWIQVVHADMFSAHQPWVKNYAFSGHDYYGAAMFARLWLDR